MRRHCDHLSAFEGHLPIGDFETFHYSPLRGNFAVWQCGDWSGRFVVGHSLRAEALVECEGRKAVCCGDWMPQACGTRLLARSTSPLSRLRRHRRDHGGGCRRLNGKRCRDSALRSSLTSVADSTLSIDSAQQDSVAPAAPGFGDLACAPVKRPARHPSSPLALRWRKTCLDGQSGISRLPASAR